MGDQHIMSKKKSLGSSPIGLKSESESMGFIPDLGVSASKQEVAKPSKGNIGVKKQLKEDTQSSQEQENDQPPEKKIVSYNLEVDLVERIKSTARQKDMYYSSFVSMVLKNWIAENS